jgi:uncharacterized membrane protein (GlpM family)
VVKLLLANTVIVACAQLGKRFPSLAGLIATMPITTLIVMIWLHSETGGSHEVMAGYAKGVLWGILPSMAFFAVAWYCIERRFPFSAVLAASFSAWLVGALLHRWLLA